MKGTKAMTAAFLMNQKSQIAGEALLICFLEMSAEDIAALRYYLTHGHFPAKVN